MLRKAEDQRRIKKLWFQVFLLLMTVAGLCGCHREKATYISMESETHSFLEAETFFNEDLDETKETDTQTQAMIYVHVCGCVKIPLCSGAFSWYTERIVKKLNHWRRMTHAGKSFSGRLHQIQAAFL